LSRAAEQSAFDPNSGKIKATLGDSMRKVLGIDENTPKGTKFLKHLLHAVSAFGHGFVGKDDPLLQAAVADFRAKRDAENASEAKKLEQDQLIKNIMVAYPWLSTNEAYQMIVDFGNAKTNEQAHDRAMQLLAQQFNNEMTAKDVDHQHDLIMQSKAFQNQTALLGQAHQNTLAQMMAAAGISAEQAPRAMIQMARAAKAYDEATGTIDAAAFGNFVRKTGGDTASKRGWDTLQGVLQAFAGGAAGATFR
jgi:hypothetical protein